MVFIVKTTALGHLEDIKCDDLGSCRVITGTKTAYEMEGIFQIFQISNLSNASFCMEYQNIRSELNMHFSIVRPNPEPGTFAVG